MRKILLLGVLLFMAAPAMAASNVTISCAVDGNEVTVSYASDANLIRAFGLDITLSDVNSSITQMNMVSTDYRIFPGQISIVEGDVNSWGTPYAADDLGDANLTVEMGSLYAADDPCKQTAPPASGTLFTFRVACNEGVESVATITLNVARGGVVMEDPDEEPSVTITCSGVVVCEGDLDCTVPNVAGMTAAAACAAIADANFTGACTTTEECNDTVADGLALRSIPAAGSAIPCDSNIVVVLSNNPALPGAATLVSPAANQKCVLLAATCSWTVGSGTVTQDIRFGTTTPPPVVSADVNAATTSYDPPGSMTVYKKYYWAIDEKNECGEVTAGTVRCFITGPQDTVTARCCLNEASPCLGNVNGDTRVNATDVSTLFAFVQGLGSPFRCTTLFPAPNACPSCYDVNGSGRVDATDVSILFATVQGWGSPFRQNCPWPNCP